MEAPNIWRGDVVESLELLDAATKGLTVARAGNFVVLVKGGLPGDVADVRIQKKKAAYAEGQVVGIRSHSPHKVQAHCGHFGVCGGCAWQDFSYAAQLQQKHKMVVDAMQRIARLEGAAVAQPLPSPKTLYYRNRLDFAFSNKRWLTTEEIKTGGDIPLQPALGFHIPGRFDKVLDVKRCHLQPDPSNKIRQSVKEYALANGLSFMDAVTKQGYLRSLIVRTSTLGQCMVILVVADADTRPGLDMLDWLQRQFPKDITSTYMVVNQKGNDTTFDLEHQLVYGHAYLQEKIGDLVYNIGPKSFFQTNSKGAEVLILKAIEMAGIQPHHKVLDLYTGVGTLALQAAAKAKEVLGVEEIEEAVGMARVNAQANKIGNATFIAGDAKKVVESLDFKADIVITDPPRVGMDAKVVEFIAAQRPQRIVYVSCNVATQARDILLLTEAGYEVKALQPVDMFPHTYHIENIAVLERTEAKKD